MPDGRDEGRGRFPSRRWLPERRATNVRRVAVAVLVYVVVAAIFAARYWVRHVQLREGSISPVTIVSPRRVVNEPLLRQMRRAALAQVAPIYVTDPRANAQVLDSVRRVFEAIRHLQGHLPANLSAGSLREAWMREVGVKVPTNVAVAILAEDPRTLANLEKAALSAFGSVLSSASYKPGQVAAEVQAMRNAVQALGLDNTQTAFLWALCPRVARPTMFYSPQETALARKRALQAVPVPVIQPGEVIVARGERVTSQQVALLAQIGPLQGQSDDMAAIGSLVFAGALVTLAGLYLWRFHRSVLLDEGRLVMCGTILVGSLILARAMSGVSPDLTLMPLPAVLLALLVDVRVALFFVLWLGLAVPVATGIPLPQDLSLMVASALGALLTLRLEQRSDLVRTSLLVGLAQALAAVGLGLMMGPVPLTVSVGQEAGLAFLDGVAAGVLTIGLLPFFESVFSVLTPVRLLELSNPRQPLLHRLLVEAPGTYHHSLIVANLAAAAAEEVQADPLLCRVGAYYHDIGKIRRPYFFVENQYRGENPHDRLAPNLSTLIVTSHVKDGVEMAREAGLPAEVTRFIMEHHGTTLVRYFYDRAVRQAKGEPVDEEEYRYPGPKPQTKETAIVMLADTCEAAVRSMPDPTTGRIEGLVRRLIRERLYDGQLDESDLTLRDLDRIARTFVRILAGAHHTRVQYPDQELKGLERRVEDHGGGVSQPADAGEAGTPDGGAAGGGGLPLSGDGGTG